MFERSTRLKVRNILLSTLALRKSLVHHCSSTDLSACALSSDLKRTFNPIVLSIASMFDRLPVQLSRRQPLLACRHRGSMQR